MARSSTTFKKGHGTSDALKIANANRCRINIPHLGKNHSDKVKKQISDSRKGKGLRERNGAWNGGTSKIVKLVRVMPEYSQWRSNIFQRDNWTCKTCNKNGIYLTAHHIKSFINIIKENNISNTIEARNCRELWDINNGVTLCENCHSLTDNYKGRATKIK